MTVSIDDINRLHDRIDEVGKDVANLGKEFAAELRPVRESIATVTTLMTVYQEKVDKHDAVIYGNNGNRGLKGDVAELKTVGRISGKTFWVVIGGVSASIAAAVNAVMFWLLKVSG